MSGPQSRRPVRRARLVGPRMARYARRWTMANAPGVIDARLVLPRATPAFTIHRRVWLGGGSWSTAVPLLPQHAWRLLRWRAGGWRRGVASIRRERLAQVADSMGIDPGLVEARLASLARRHGIPPGEALHFGLVAADGLTRWPEYVYRNEERWNAAAGGARGARQVLALGDKVATAERLAAAGVPTVPSLLVPPLPPGADWRRKALDWLDRWPQVHVKRRHGSRGVGAFELSEDRRLVLRQFQHDEAEADPVAWMAANATGHELLVQPRLESHAALVDVADPSDVVTIRAVTRDLGGGPELFCSWIEVPLPIAEGRQFYVLSRIDGDGVIRELAVAQWWRKELLDETRESGRQSAAVAASLRGRTVPGYAELVRHALLAHRQFPGLFAAAWDVAVTSEGNLFLEGNGGFGVDTPQVISGGLLRGIS